MRRRARPIVLTAMVALACQVAAGAGSSPRPMVPTASLRAEVDAFFDREMVAHLQQIPFEGPLPDRVHGALTTGEFTWGTFVRALAAFADLRETRVVAGRDVVPFVARVGVIESANGGKAFAQLYAALALRHFGRDLAQNALWVSLTDGERVAWKALLDPTRFYDPRARRVIDLPENYLGVASRVAALSFQMGLLQDRAFVDALLDRAAEPFTKGALYADDAGTAGRYDRYSNEYARYVYEAATVVGRKDLLDALRPSLVAQLRLWWDLMGPDGYGYQWGRSLGVVSYLDTLEIVAFAARHPAFRPAPLPELAAAYRLAWRWLRDNYDPDRHLLMVFAPGRGNYAYITKAREWQQNVGFFGKTLVAQATLMDALAAEGVTAFPERPALPPVARFEFFRRGERPAGAWLVRQGALRFVLPITTGTRPGVADYLPAPHGLAGFAAPVEQTVPAGATFYEMTDGRTLAATDGADEVVPGADGRSLRATWRGLVTLGDATGHRVDPGFEVTISWQLDGERLTRTESLTATRDVTIRRLSFLVSSTATHHMALAAGQPLVSGIRLAAPDGVLDVRVEGDLRMAGSLRTVGDEPLGRGPRLPIPTHVTFTAADVHLRAGRPRTWVIRFDASNALERTIR